MKYFIQKNINTKFGYELVQTDNDGNEEIISLNRKTTDNCLYLPENCKNDTNRALISIKMLDKTTTDRYEIVPKEYKTPRILGNNKKPLEDYLNDEDKELYLALVEKAKNAREEAAKKPMTEEEKLKAKIAKYQAQYEALLAQSK